MKERVTYMDCKIYIPQIKITFLLCGLRIQKKGSDKEATWLVPVNSNRWSLPIHGIVVSHSEERIQEGTAEIWVYLHTSLYNHKKTGGASMENLLAHSARLQTDLVKLHGYEYDKEYECHDGTVVLFKKVSFEQLAKELGKVVAMA